MNLTDLSRHVGCQHGTRREFDYVAVLDGVAYVTTGACAAQAPAPGFPDGYYELPLFMPVNDPTLPSSADMARKIIGVFDMAEALPSHKYHSGIDERTPRISVHKRVWIHVGDSLFESRILPVDTQRLLYLGRTDKSGALLYEDGSFVQCEAKPGALGI